MLEKNTCCSELTFNFLITSCFFSDVRANGHLVTIIIWALFAPFLLSRRLPVGSTKSSVYKSSYLVSKI